MTALALRSSRAKSRGAKGAPRSTPLDFARDERVFVIAAISFLLTAAAPQTAVDAERAFAADAQSEGQWTAFRKWAAPDAIMFLPQPTQIHDWLKGKSDPQLAYMWWPAAAYVSCDGNTAVTTGPSVRCAYRGYFTTIWRKQADGSWKWLLDHGDQLAVPRPARDAARVTEARCSRSPIAPLIGTVQEFQGGQRGQGQSEDGSLRWQWATAPDGRRIVSIDLAQDRGGRIPDFKRVLHDQVAAPAP